MVNDLLKQHFMECQLSSTLALPWAWVLETVARSSQVDLSLLLDLVKKAPESSNGTFRNVKELVFLRILERIYIQGTQEPSSSSSQKIGLDPSERCEDVFRRIIPETSAFNLKTVGAEVLKWDIWPYIERKRSSLGKSSLEQVKDAILTGSHPSLVSLREASGLPVGNQPETDAPVDSSDCNNVETRATITESHPQICAGNDQLFSEGLTETMCPLSENLSLKRKRSATTEIVETEYCKDLIIWEDSFEAIMRTVKKYKPDCISSEQDLCTDSILGMDRQRTDASLKIAQHGEVESRTFVKESRRLSLRSTRPPGDVYEEQTSPKGLLGQGEDLPSEKPASHHASKVPNKKSCERQRQDSNNEDTECGERGWRDKADKYLDKSAQNSERNPTEAEKVNGCCDSDRQHDEIADIARRKESFLSSHGQGSLTDDWSELNLCVKCGKGENVLICCSNSCPVAIHENCMVSVASFDKDGKYYCPFCAYSRAISDYQEAKKKASAARIALGNFVFAGAQKETEESPESHSTIKKHSKQMGGLVKSNEPKNKHSREFYSGDGRHPIGVVGPTDRPPRNSSKQRQDRRRTRLLPVRDQGYHQMDGNAQQVSERSDEHPEIRSKNGISGPAETGGVPCEDKSSPSTETVNEEEISEEVYDSSADVDEITEEKKQVNRGASKSYISVKKSKEQRSYSGRKRRLLWTNEEEDMLREAVRENYNPEDVIIPWKKILEYGAGTFHEDRTAGQLKDKWRNLCKAMN